MDNDDDILELLIDLSEEKQHNHLWNYNSKHIQNYQGVPKITSLKKVTQKKIIQINIEKSPSEAH